MNVRLMFFIVVLGAIVLALVNGGLGSSPG
jgi:hypothetical protein